MRSRIGPALWLMVPLCSAACGGDDDDEVALLDAGIDAQGDEDAGDAAIPTARLEVHERGDDTEIDRLLFFDPFDVVVSEAPPDTAVTLRGHRRGWSSEAVFTTDAEGAASTLTSASTSGTYTGVEPDGIVWSMLPVEGEEPDLGATLDLELEIDGHVVARTVLTRLLSIEGVELVEVDDPAIVGTLYLPPGAGPFPGMLAFGGSEGGRFMEGIFGPYFASKGYATLGIAYFGAEGVPPALQEIPLEYFGHALSWLGARPEVDPERLGVFGASRGGELALLLGATFPEVRAVVAGVPSGVVWPGIVEGSVVPAWTLGGVGLPYIPAGGRARTEPGPDDATMYVYRPAFEESLEYASEEARAAATIHVEQTNGPILMLAGDDDQLWPSCTLAEIAAERLAAEHASTFADEYVCYPEAGHFIVVPGGPTTRSNMYPNPDGTWWLVGGTPRGNAHGQRDALDRTLRFLAESLGEPGL